MVAGSSLLLGQVAHRDGLVEPAPQLAFQLFQLRLDLFLKRLIQKIQVLFDMASVVNERRYEP